MTAGHFYLRVIEPVTASRGLSHGAEAWKQEQRGLLLLQACRMPRGSILLLLLLFAWREQLPGLLLRLSTFELSSQTSKGLYF